MGPRGTACSFLALVASSWCVVKEYGVGVQETGLGARSVLILAGHEFPPLKLPFRNKTPPESDAPQALSNLALRHPRAPAYPLS